MATLTPAIGTSAFDSTGERRLAERLEQKLHADDLAGAVNAELTRLYWSVGERLRTEVLGGADRAKYGDQLIQRVGEQLAQEFGRGFEAKNLRRMVQFAQAFPQPKIVATIELEPLCQPAAPKNRGRTPVLRQPSCHQHLERARATPANRTQGL